MVPCVGVPAEADLESLLRGFQAKDPHSSEAFFEAVSPTLKRMARRYLPSFPIDVREELVGETLMLLQSRNTARFDGTRGNAWKYIHGFAINAAKGIRRANGFRRRRSRLREESDDAALGPRFISIDELNLDPADDRTGDLDRRILISQVLKRAPTLVGFALRQVYILGRSQQEVARGLRKDRFYLKRQIGAFSDAVSYLRPVA